MRMSPASGRSNPAIMRSVVVLPQPEGPSSEMNSPGWIVSDRSSTASLVAVALRDAVEDDAAATRPAVRSGNLSRGAVRPRSPVSRRGGLHALDYARAAHVASARGTRCPVNQTIGAGCTGVTDRPDCDGRKPDDSGAPSCACLTVSSDAMFVRAPLIESARQPRQRLAGRAPERRCARGSGRRRASRRG